MGGKIETGWSWWAAEVHDLDEKPETYMINEPTRDAVVAAARREFGRKTFIAIVEATQAGGFDARPFGEDGDGRLIEDTLDQFRDDNGDRWGEGDGPVALPTEDLAKRLNDAFEAFIAENLDAVMEGAWTFTETRNAEVLSPEPVS